MEILIGIGGMAVLVGLYVGLGMADHAEDGCDDCVLHRDDGSGCGVYGATRESSTCTDFSIHDGSDGNIEP
ncbi:MAG TPA: hypothetical protein VKB18_02935 [Gemmatimonadota bacterium]|nr:hypothetical protein [Gemmatimonadota bacterium]